tara:strand:- start:168 stop:317 length:150 start_codon:yes stop_codon:yes gene_type:complete
MKKRKLNSSNPKYSPAVSEKEKIKERRVLIATIYKSSKNPIKAYAIFTD